MVNAINFLNRLLLKRPLKVNREEKIACKMLMYPVFIALFQTIFSSPLFLCCQLRVKSNVIKGSFGV
ncbi:MAG: hypothetical protein CK426_02375 [Legionella sp.]|nr:MAG: hypothetical protein CK423_00705 [Legionella sp.]PJD99648.1 MAG: hypothetical protein CK426_02375 [Legionella sp.]